jgi:hypothetical protein
MGPWRSIRQLRDDFKASGIELPTPKRLPQGPGTQGCRGKVRHITRADAERHVDTLLQQVGEHRRRRERLGTYRCMWCQGFHVGHSLTRRRKVRLANGFQS